MSNFYLEIRWFNVVMAVWSALCYCYIDRFALVQFWRGRRDRLGNLLMSKGNFFTRVGRIIFLFASANGTFVAIKADSPGGQQVIGIFVGLFCIATGCTWMAAAAWRARHPRPARDKDTL